MNDETNVIDTDVVETTETTEDVDTSIPVDFNLSNNRKVSITVKLEVIEQNMQNLQQDINKFLNILQNVICVDDEHRTQVQDEAINAVSLYLANFNVPLTDYFHMGVDDYRLATTMTMDAIVACNTLILAVKNHNEDYKSGKVSENN